MADLSTDEIAVEDEEFHHVGANDTVVAAGSSNDSCGATVTVGTLDGERFSEDDNDKDLGTAATTVTVAVAGLMHVGQPKTLDRVDYQQQQQQQQQRTTKPAPAPKPSTSSKTSDGPVVALGMVLAPAGTTASSATLEEGLPLHVSPVAPIPAPPALMRTEQTRPPWSRPGAFASIPGLEETLTPLQPPHYSSLHHLARTIAESTTTNQTVEDIEQQQQQQQQQQDGLVQAHLISDDHDEPASAIHGHAEEYQAHPTRSKTTLTFRSGLCFVSTVVSFAILLAGILLLVLYYTTDLFHSNEEMKIKVVTTTPTAAPSFLSSSSAAAALTPSLPPIPFLVPLPASTRQAIALDPTSPQARAYQWLQKDIGNTTSYMHDFNDSEARFIQRFALATIYYATRGDDWTLSQYWLSHDQHECYWYTKAVAVPAATINDVNDTREEFQTRDDDVYATERVTNTSATILNGVCIGNFYVSLQLTSNNLKGHLPQEVALLTRLEVLDVAKNEIAGSLPSELGLLTSLKELVMSFNNLSGTIPIELTSLTAMETLMLHENHLLSGSIPTEFGLLTNLQFFEIVDTKVGGTIPSELGLLTHMSKLFLSRNRLSGSLPSELFGFTDLWFAFALSNNQLTGTIPTEIGALFNTLVVLLDDNNLSGTIPTQVGSLAMTKYIFLSANDLSGTIPTHFGNIPGLREIHLHDNPVVGTIPTQLGNLQELRQLLLNSTNLSGSLPSELGLLTDLTKLHLDNTFLSGSIPIDWSNMEGRMMAKNHSLESVQLVDTFITGSIPVEICGIPDLDFGCSDTLCGCECSCNSTTNNVTNS